MKPLYKVIESLLDSDFDITDNDIISSKLCDWVQTANKLPFKEASDALKDIFSNTPEISPMKRAKLVETNVVVSIDLNPAKEGARISIVYRGKKSCCSHITFTWFNGQQYRNGKLVAHAYTQKGIHNLVNYNNKRKSPTCHYWAIPPDVFDDIYKCAP